MTVLCAWLAWAGMGPAGTLEPVERRAVITEIARQLRESYVLPEVGNRLSQGLEARAASGAYDSIRDGHVLADRLTSELQAASHDGHLQVRYHTDPDRVMPAWNTPTPEEQTRHRRHGEVTNFGFVKLELLSGNVGLLQLDEFGDPARGGDTATAAMTFFAHTDALIVDLRANGGGYPGIGAVLQTYLLGKDPVRLGDFVVRDDGVHTVQTWTLPYVPGPAYAGKPVYLVTGPKTASGGEAFAYELQSLKRAIVVGERTAGHAHAGSFKRLSRHFALFVPNGRPVNAVTGANWEGTGVRPDVEVAVELALDRAHALALESLLARVPQGAEERERLQAALLGLTSPRGPRQP